MKHAHTTTHLISWNFIAPLVRFAWPIQKYRNKVIQTKFREIHLMPVDIHGIWVLWLRYWRNTSPFFPKVFNYSPSKNVVFGSSSDGHSSYWTTTTFSPCLWVTSLGIAVETSICFIWSLRNCGWRLCCINRNPNQFSLAYTWLAQDAVYHIHHLPILLKIHIDGISQSLNLPTKDRRWTVRWGSRKTYRTNVYSCRIHFSQHFSEIERRQSTGITMRSWRNVTRGLIPYWGIWASFQIYSILKWFIQLTVCSYVPPFVFWWVVTYLDITNFLYCLKYSGRRTMNDQQPYLNGMIPQQRMVESGLQGAHHTIYEIPISTLRSQTNQVIYWSFCWIFNVSKAERNSKILTKI